MIALLIRLKVTTATVHRSTAGSLRLYVRQEWHFQTPLPNTRWVAGFTYMPTAEGWLYLAVVLDLLAASDGLSSIMDAQLVIDALLMAIWRHGAARKLLHHPDQGSQTRARTSSACLPRTASLAA